MQFYFLFRLCIALRFFPITCGLPFLLLTSFLSPVQSRSVRDFDNHATCIVGKFEVFAAHLPKHFWILFFGLLNVNSYLLRQWIRTIAIAVLSVLSEGYLFHCFASVLWMIQFVRVRQFLGMSAGIPIPLFPFQNDAFIQKYLFHLIFSVLSSCLCFVFTEQTRILYWRPYHMEVILHSLKELLHTAYGTSVSILPSSYQTQFFFRYYARFIIQYPSKPSAFGKFLKIFSDCTNLNCMAIGQ